MASLSHSPNSPSEPQSDAEGPVLTKHVYSAQIHTPQMHPKTTQQRSSSINSLGSTHSTHQRSMSLVSLESPRNSIVSIDDFFIRPTRNNSSSSLASLGGAGSPKETPKDGPTFSSRLPKGKFKASCVILSDEEILESEHHSFRFLGKRRKSGDKVPKPTFLSSLKNDFKFKYDHDCKQKLPTSSMNTASALGSRLVEEGLPSPLSLSIEGSNQAVNPLNTLEEEIPAPHVRAPISGKKIRSSSMTQSMFLKKKFLLSKDLQLEFLSGHSNSLPSSNATVPETKFPFPSVLLPKPNRDLIHNFFSSQGNESTSPQHLLPVPSSNPHLLNLNVLLRTSSSTPRPISPSSISSNQSSDLPVDQNALLSKLNRKWNRSAFAASTDGDLGDCIFNSVVSSRKRSRSGLVSSADSFSVAGTH